jgi:hypothetical protein
LLEAAVTAAGETAGAAVQTRRFLHTVAAITDSADTNAAMMRINHMLGYTPTHTTIEYQLDL